MIIKRMQKILDTNFSKTVKDKMVIVSNFFNDDYRAYLNDTIAISVLNNIISN